MIAPLRETNTVACDQRHRLCEARKYLATTLFNESREDRGPAVASSKAWLLVAWIVLTSSAYAMSMLGWW